LVDVALNFRIWREEDLCLDPASAPNAATIQSAVVGHQREVDLAAMPSRLCAALAVKLRGEIVVHRAIVCAETRKGKSVNLACHSVRGFGTGAFSTRSIWISWERDVVPLEPGLAGC